MGGLDAQKLQQRLEVVGVGIGLVGRHVRLAETAHVITHDLVVFGKLGKLIVPVTCVPAKTVNKNYRFAFTRHLEVQMCTIHIGIAFL